VDILIQTIISRKGAKTQRRKEEKKKRRKEEKKKRRKEEKKKRRKEEKKEIFFLNQCRGLAKNQIM
jgi:hypothetical protein